MLRLARPEKRNALGDETVPGIEGAVGAVNSGPLRTNEAPGRSTLPDGKTVPLNPAKDVAFHALSHAYSGDYLICRVATPVAVLLLGGRTHQSSFAEPDGPGVSQA